MSAQHVVDNEAGAPANRYWPEALKKLGPPPQHLDLVADALAGAARILMAELNDRVTYINGSTVRGLDDREMAERWFTKAIDLLDGGRGVLRDEKKYKAQRFGACTVVFGPSGELLY